MMPVLLALIALCSAFVACLAGPHAGGVLAIDALPHIEYSTQETPLCDEFGGDLPLPCNDLVTNLPAGGGQTFLWQILAIFPELSSPRLSGVTLALDYDDSNIVIENYGTCGDFEVFMEDWPAPNNGVVVNWVPPKTTKVTAIYMFAGYAHYATSLDVIGHPWDGGVFADDSVPAELDPVFDFGRLGFGEDAGYGPCPNPVLGACCLSDGSCLELSESDCEDVGGVFYLSEPCSEEPCEPVPAIRASWGAVKRSFR